MSNDLHWATPLIGRPWEYGAQGPDAFDCWHFVRWVQREHFGIEMPTVEVPRSWEEAHRQIESHQERAKWQKVDGNPQEGDVVLMARNRIPVHIGVAINANGKSGVLHCVQNSGVVFQDPPGLRSAGWGSLTYFRRKHHDS